MIPFQREVGPHLSHRRPSCCGITALRQDPYDTSPGGAGAGVRWGDNGHMRCQPLPPPPPSVPPPLVFVSGTKTGGEFIRHKLLKDLIHFVQ